MSAEPVRNMSAEQVAVTRALIRYINDNHGQQFDLPTQAHLLLLALRGAGLRVTLPPPCDRTLSDRQLQILELISQGLENPDIGRALFVSEDTIKTHNRRLFKVLGVKARAHAVRRGFELGLLS